MEKIINKAQHIIAVTVAQRSQKTKISKKNNKTTPRSEVLERGFGFKEN